MLVNYARTCMVVDMKLPLSRPGDPDMPWWWFFILGVCSGVTAFSILQDLLGL